jgi:hypothetical protein
LARWGLNERKALWKRGFIAMLFGGFGRD